MNYLREIDDVIDTVKRAKEKNTNVNLLIGAGCSVSANIPLAEGIVDEIRRNYPREYNRAEVKDYATCMSKLTPIERKNLIIDKVNNAKINWAHIAIAQLLKNNYINRVLTTNFDNLILRACSLVGEYPAIYDLATSVNFRSDLLFDKSVLHLHGQHTGFILCNTSDEVEKQSKVLKDVFNDLKQQSLWIVVGYSGNNDPIFNLLAEEESFEHRLFWVGYLNNEPSEKLVNNLLGEQKYAFYVKDYDADDFFVTLARRLKCFPPDFIKKPFTHLSATLDLLTQYKLPKEETFYYVDDLNVSTRDIVKEAVEEIESDNVRMANHFLTVGLHEEFYDLVENCKKEEIEKILPIFNSVKTKTIGLLEEECKKISEEVEKNINNEKLIIKWAKALRNLSRLHNEEKAIGLLIESNKKYELAVTATV